MSRLVLRRPEGTCTYYKITSGRKWIGRVYPHADGHFVGKIGGHEARGATAHEAFDNVGALYFGYKSVGDLQVHNRAVRQAKEAAKARARYAFDEIMKGNFKPLDELFTLK